MFWGEGDRRVGAETVWDKGIRCRGDWRSVERGKVVVCVSAFGIAVSLKGWIIRSMWTRDGDVWQNWKVIFVTFVPASQRKSMLSTGPSSSEEITRLQALHSSHPYPFRSHRGYLARKTCMPLSIE